MDLDIRALDVYFVTLQLGAILTVQDLEGRDLRMW